MIRVLTPPRRRILVMLAQAGLRPVPYIEIHDELGYRSKQTSMWHVDVLRRARLIERVGSLKQRIGYRLRPNVAVSCRGQVYRIVWRKSDGS